MMYDHRLKFVYVLVAIVGTAGIAAALQMLALSPRIEQVRVYDPKLTSSSSLADVRARFAAPPQTIPGEVVAEQIAGVCPQVDVYQGTEYAALVCHP